MIESLRESVDELDSIQMDSVDIPRSSSQSLGDKSSQKSQIDSAPIVKVSQTKDVINEDSDDEPIITADADLTVIVEELDESIISSKSICSSRDDLSSSLDYYEVCIDDKVDNDDVNDDCAGYDVDRDRPHKYSGVHLQCQQAPTSAQRRGGQERHHDVPVQTQAAL